MVDFDSDISQVLIEILKKNDTNRILTSTPTMIKLFAFWNPAESKWDSGPATDPLSLFLLSKNPERERATEEEEAFATCAKALNRNLSWVQSFLCGWHGRSNENGSITGFLLGTKFRQQYLKS